MPHIKVKLPLSRKDCQETIASRQGNIARRLASRQGKIPLRLSSHVTVRLPRDCCLQGQSCSYSTVSLTLWYWHCLEKIENCHNTLVSRKLSMELGPRLLIRYTLVLVESYFLTFLICSKKYIFLHPWIFIFLLLIIKTFIATLFNTMIYCIYGASLNSSASYSFLSFCAYFTHILLQIFRFLLASILSKRSPW